MKKIKTTIFMLALTFFFANANAQKVTLKDLEQWGSYSVEYVPVVTKLGFKLVGDYAKYAEGKDSAQLFVDTNMELVFSTNNLTLYNQLKAEIPKNGYAPLEGVNNNEKEGLFSKKHYSLNYTYSTNYTNSKAEIEPFKYHIGLIYNVGD